MRNLYKPNRYNVASIQAQQTMGGDVMQSDEEGQYVEWRDYKRALDEIEMLKHTIKYWEIEAKTDNDRWLQCLEEVERLREKLKAEVERLNTGIQPEGSNDAVGRAVNVLLEKEKENALLKAEVESLYRHGDLMLKFACANMPYPPYATMAKDWMAVKEGKQS